MSVLSPGTELTRFRAGVLPRVALGVLLFIPLIYGALYLWAFWSPTENLDQIAVALVDEDQPVALSDGTTIDAGTEVVTELVESADLGWVLTDADDAAEGVAHGEYYFAVTIPADFSASLASVDSADPVTAPLEVHYNETNSFLATTLGRTAMDRVHEAVADTTAARTSLLLIEGVDALSAGLSDAADGAATLDDATTEVADGAAALEEGLQGLDAGAQDLSAGASTLADGAGDLADGATQVATGAGSLAAGASSLADGTDAVASGAEDLDGGLATLSTGAEHLSQGLSALDEQTATLTDDAAALDTGATQLRGALGLISQIAAADPTASLADVDAALRAQGSSLTDLAAGASQLAQGTSTLADAAPDLVGAISALDSGAGDLAAGATEAEQGADSLAQGARAAASGARDVSAGATTLSAGASEVSGGASRLAHGADDLEDGAARLASGVDDALDGGVTLADGADQVSAGAGDLSSALSDGASRAPHYSDSQAASMSEVMADPVALEAMTENETQGFGEGFAPFFIALAAFVGALITWLILRPLPVRLLGTRASGLRTVLTGFVPAALLGLGQTLIMVLVLVLLIGVSPVHLLGMTLFVLLTTLAFLALQQMFVVLLGSAAGRVVSLVLLMLQLSSSSGTYPVETSPRFFQILHPFMPASYVVDGLRAMIGGGVDARFWAALAYMVGLLAVSLTISAIAAGRQKVWTIARLHPELSI